METDGRMQLEGMEFFSHHGCLEREKVAGNIFTVDFDGFADMSDAADSDDLSAAVDYGMLYDEIARQMETPSNLLENVAGRIVKAIEDRFPQFKEFSVRVSKRCPPVKGKCAWSRITLYSSGKR